MTKCAEHPLHRDKFTNGKLEFCENKSSHVIKAGHQAEHNEFCDTYQNSILAEFEKATSRVPEPIVIINNRNDDQWASSDDWNNAGHEATHYYAGKYKK